MAGVTWELEWQPIDVEEEVQQKIDMFDLFDRALELGVITKKGSWYSFEDETLGQGNKARDLSDDLKHRINESISSR